MEVEGKGTNLNEAFENALDKVEEKSNQIGADMILSWKLKDISGQIGTGISGQLTKEIIVVLIAKLP